MRLLMVNGNRTQSVTDAVIAEARHCAAPDTDITGATSAFGADIVSMAADNVVAAHAVLDTLARRAGSFDAAVLAISLDSGLGAARQLLPVPVVGITESAMLTACLLGERFGLVTFGRQTRPMYLELAERYGVARRLAGCRTIDTSSLTDYLDPHAMAQRIVGEAQALVADDRADSVVICGAALAGVARRLQPHVSVPLLDGIVCAVRHAETLARARYPKALAYPAGSVPRMEGIGRELAALFHANGAPSPR